MPSRTLRTAVLALLVSFGFVEAASAYYNPRTGRFLNRDPIGEPGFMLVQQVAGSTFLPRDASGTAGRVIVRRAPTTLFLPRDNAAGEQTVSGIGSRPVVGHATCRPDGRCEYVLLSAGSVVSTELEPAENQEELNLYGYVKNDPMDNIDPYGLSTKCGTRYCMCTESGSRPVNVYGNSRRAKAILEAGFGKGATGCVTLLNWFTTGAEIYCTGSCAEIKKWKAGPGVPILDHECCHACDYFDKCVCKYFHGAIWDDCTKRAKGGFETW
jgi:hypothetical protein